MTALTYKFRLVKEVNLTNLFDPGKGNQAELADWDYTLPFLITEAGIRSFTTQFVALDNRDPKF